MQIYVAFYVKDFSKVDLELKYNVSTSDKCACILGY